MLTKAARELCEQIQVEQNSTKLNILVEKLIAELRTEQDAIREEIKERMQKRLDRYSL